MTIIFSNAGDQDCQTLRQLWNGFDDARVIEVTRTNISPNTFEEIDQAIALEHDTLILCGHGSPEGLLCPNFSGYLFHKHNKDLVKARNVLCIWCYAKSFCLKYGFPCLTSSMYISNSMEARMNGIFDIPQDYINQTNEDTFAEMNQLLHSQTPMKQWVDLLNSTLDHSNPIDTFNRHGMTYIGS